MNLAVATVKHKITTVDMIISANGKSFLLVSFSNLTSSICSKSGESVIVTKLIIGGGRGAVTQVNRVLLSGTFPPSHALHVPSLNTI